jgi:hypothetical protein
VQGTRLQAALDRMIRDAEHTRTAHDAERREWAEHERALVDARAAAVAVQAELAQARVVRVLDTHARCAHTHGRRQAALSARCMRCRHMRRPSARETGFARAYACIPIYSRTRCAARAFAASWRDAVDSLVRAWAVSADGVR